MKDEYEATIKALKLDNSKLSEENLELKEKVRGLESTSADLLRKCDQRQKEIDRLIQEMKRKDKMHEDRINGINKSNAGLFETQGKLKSEAARLKQEVG